MKVLIFLSAIMVILVGAQQHDPRCPIMTHTDEQESILYPHESDRSKYLSCSSFGTMIELTCLNGLEFDSEANMCTEEVVHTRIAPISTSMMSCTKEQEGEMFTNFDDGCQSFYLCNNRIASLVNCARGLLFNSKLQICDYANNVVCEAKKIEIVNDDKVEEILEVDEETSDRVENEQSTAENRCGCSSCSGSQPCNGGCSGSCNGGCSESCNGGCSGSWNSECSESCNGGCSGSWNGECSESCNGGCSESWNGGCSESCNGGCAGSCNGGCSDSCNGGCSGSCNGGCSESCNGGCSGSCNGGCSQTCNEGCSQPCNGGCSGSWNGGCSQSCNGGCSGSCNGGYSQTCNGGCNGSCNY